MPTEMSTRPARRPLRSTAPARAEHDEARAAKRRYARQLRRFRINLVAWIAGSILLTTLWVAVEWNANGAFERVAHEGNPGDWNPTLWALGVGLWGLAVGIMALRVRFRRPVSATDVDREVRRLLPRGVPVDAAATPELRAVARTRLERIRRLTFHVAAWVLGMVVVAPLNALVEWQDNGAFERLSSDSRPGSWDPWVLAVGGIWAAVVAALAVAVYVDRRRSPGG